MDKQIRVYPRSSSAVLCSSSAVRLCAIPWTGARQAPLSMGFFRQEYWNGLPCPPPEDLPNPGIEPVPPTLQADFFTHWGIREAQRVLVLQSYPNRHSGKNSHWLIKSKEFFKGVFLPLMLQKVDFFLKIGLSSITLWVNILPWARMLFGERLWQCQYF